MIFPNLIFDNLVQEADKFRFIASKSFVGSGEVLDGVRIYPDFDNDPATFYDVFVENCPEEWVLDYAYETAGDYTVRLELSTTTPATKVKDYTITVVTEADDNLQSSDSMLYAYESELINYLPDGRNSWKYLHRKALEEILDYLYRNGIYRYNPEESERKDLKIEKEDLKGDKLEKWATFETMIMIFQDIKSSNIAFFNEKIDDYTALRNDARKIYMIKIDSNRDGQVDEKDTPTSTRQHFLSR